jgi:hypothetical protein
LILDGEERWNCFPEAAGTTFIVGSIAHPSASVSINYFLPPFGKVEK